MADTLGNLTLARPIIILMTWATHQIIWNY